jgi:plastocyanin
MTKLPLLIVGTSALAVALMSCGNKRPNETPAASNPTGKAVDAAAAGSVTGVVKLDGIPPKMRVINMAAEPACAKVHANQPAMTEDVVPGSNGTLQNVVVYLQDDFNQYTFAVPTAPITIDQKGCQYFPHVLALRTGQALQVINSDPVTHNIHPLPKDNREWNQSQPPGATPIEQSFARQEVAIPVKCNIHPWMKAYIAVLNNPYFEVTGSDGSFDIKDVPPGTYTVTAWQERYGMISQSVTVQPKESSSVTLTYKATPEAS